MTTDLAAVGRSSGSISNMRIFRAVDGGMQVTNKTPHDQPILLEQTNEISFSKNGPLANLD